MLIHLIRHTTPNIESGICYGQKNLTLADTFLQEKKLIIKHLIAHYNIVYSSPLQRCKKLAQTIKADHLSLEADLMEVNFGDWEGVAWNDIPRSKSQAWMDDFVNIAPPNGESLLQMQLRVQGFINQHIEPNQHEHIAIVTHAGVIRLFFAWVLNIPLQDIFKIKLDYGTVIEMDYQGIELGATMRFL